MKQLNNPHKRPHITGSATKFERLSVFIFDEPTALAHQVAKKIANLIQEKDAVGEMTVLGLPTGATPIGVYHELIRMHREEGLDFSNVITFNLDEYFPMLPGNLQSYHRFMHENLFDHINIAKENIHIPRGDIAHEAVEQHCDEYERQIRRAGGIDLMLLGIGRSGHIGFNEPGSRKDDRTRMIVLDEITRKDAASDFFEEKYVPREAITMGVGSILDCREIILMATGEHKAPIIRKAVEEAPSSQVTASFLQEHPNAAFYVDAAAAQQLTRIKTPWIVGDCDWTPELRKRAVIWLSEQEQKPITHLEESDFHRNHLHGVIHGFKGDTDDLCLSVFQDLRSRIFYKEQLPKRKRIIVFSPHPDDDVISMGGMLGALVENENEVLVAYMTNGSVAVFDQDVARHLRFLEMTAPILFGKDANAQAKTKPLFDFLAQKKPAQVDADEIQKIKAYIRYTEAIAGIEVMGLTEKNARFLDLPFYKTGQVKKAPISKADTDIIVDLFDAFNPEHIFIAGDLSDPHGTHRMCYTAIRQGLSRWQTQKSSSEKPLLWLYRGAWQEWEIDKASCFLPMSKSDLQRKIDAIYKHESQKDRALFPGAYDSREFWERARDRNVATAKALSALGLPTFFAMEAFVTCKELP